jgi:hypothetical protein
MEKKVTFCLTHGIPGAIYADQYTIFQSPGEATLA